MFNICAYRAPQKSVSKMSIITVILYLETTLYFSTPMYLWCQDRPLQYLQYDSKCLDLPPCSPVSSGIQPVIFQVEIVVKTIGEPVMIMLYTSLSPRSCPHRMSRKDKSGSVLILRQAYAKDGSMPFQI